MLISSSFKGMGMPCQGIVPWDYTLQGCCPKRTFLQGSSPKRTFSWCWLVCLCHVIKTTNMADKLEKHSLFRQKQAFCINIKVFCWLTCGRTRVINLFWVGVGSDPDPSGSIWPTPAQTSLKSTTDLERNINENLVYIYKSTLFK